MTKKAAPTKKKTGRPSKFSIAYCKQVEKLCKLGATDVEIAEFFNVNPDTIYEWKNKHKAFSEAIKRGKQIADAEVADKLFNRATGYSHDDVDIKVIRGKIRITKLLKHYPPDTAAAIFWLKNRQKDKWRDKQDVEVKGNIHLSDEPIVFE